MIHEHKGDITTVTSGIILHGVNCQGVMGAGVAKAIRNKWPQVYQSYRYFFSLSFKAELIGTNQVVPINDALTVVNCFTQEDYGREGHRYVSYDAMDTCMENVAIRFQKGVIHFPLIGCGLAGGHWPVVREIIEHRLPDSRFEKHLWTL